MSGCCCCTVVSQDRVQVVENCGKFEKFLFPGCHILCWPLQVVVGDLNRRVQQLDVNCETKTKDNVTVTVTTSIQYMVDMEGTEENDRDGLYNAFYKLSNVQAQLSSYVFDAVRSTLPTILLDDVFENKDEIATVVKSNLDANMKSYGYEINTVLINDIDIEHKVKAAMNEINTNKRLREAAQEKAEAEKILVVKAAEADSESKYLQGVGISRQRQAIVQGLRDSVVDFTAGVGDVSPKDVLQLMLLTQYFDMLKDVGQSSKNVVFIPHAPGNVDGLSEQLRQAMMEAGAANPPETTMARA